MAVALDRYTDAQPIVLALPRGGVPVAEAIAKELRAPLDVLLVRKLGAPGQPELALGAVSEDGVTIINQDAVRALDVPQSVLQMLEEREREVLRAQSLEYRLGRAPLAVEGRTVILVDDGLATGASMIAAITALRARDPAKVIVAVPVAPPDTVDVVRRYADAVHALETPQPFGSVGSWYADFSQVSDQDVRNMLA